jgi:hypothetical protein
MTQTLVTAILEQRFTDANQTFMSLIEAKMQVAIAQERTVALKEYAQDQPKVKDQTCTKCKTDFAPDKAGQTKCRECLGGSVEFSPKRLKEDSDSINITAGPNSQFKGKKFRLEVDKPNSGYRIYDEKGRYTENGTAVYIKNFYDVEVPKVG